MDLPSWAYRRTGMRAREMVGDGMHPADAVSEAAWEVAGEVVGDRALDTVRGEVQGELARRTPEPTAGDFDLGGL